MNQRSRRKFYLLCIALTAAGLLCSRTVLAQIYRITPLFMPGSDYTAGEEVSRNGIVAGGGFDDTGAPFAYRYDGSLHLLGSPVGSLGAYAQSVNAKGIAVGYALDAGGLRQAVAWFGDSPVLLGTLGGNRSDARGINNAGMIVGTSRNVHNVARPFLYTLDEGMVELPITLGGAAASSNAINDAGKVVGSARTPLGANQAYRYDLTTGQLDALGTLGGTNSFANGISENGNVVGLSDMANGEFHPFYWSEESGMIDLFAFGDLGSPFGAAYDVNSAGQVVGYGEIDDDYNSHAFLWTQEKGLLDLNTALINGAGWKLFGAAGINEKGEIVGWGQYNGAAAGFLLQPVPEPSALAMFATFAGAGAILWIRRRRRDQ